MTDSVRPGSDLHRSDTVDPRDTGEHFFGALVKTPLGDDAEITVAAGDRAVARRVADLTNHIDFLEREITRYRDLIETERIKHSTELANVQLEVDTHVDEVHRTERSRTQALHDSYRDLLNERQMEFDRALSTATTESAAELVDERRRYEAALQRERARNDAQLEANRKQTIDELDEAHTRARQTWLNELDQATATIDRLKADVDTFVSRASNAETQAHDTEVQLAAAHQRLEDLSERHQAHIDTLDAQVATATKRLDDERQRSAATLSELLERSASIASEADNARAGFKAQLTAVEQSAEAALLQARESYTALEQAADDRASVALQREAELEAVIAELRAQLPRKRP